MRVKREGDRLIFVADEFYEYMEGRARSLADLITNMGVSLVLVSFALLCLYFVVPTYVYLAAFLIPFLIRGMVMDWVQNWVKKEFKDVMP